MAGILATLGQILTIGKAIDEHGSDAKKLLEVLESQDVQLLRTDGSMMRLLNSYIVEPVAVVSKELKDDEIIDKVLGLHTDMFTGFYMQAYSILTNVFGKNTSVAIDVLGTDTGGLSKVFLRGAKVAVEDRDFLGELMCEEFSLSTEANRKKFDLNIKNNARNKITEHNNKVTSDKTKNELDDEVKRLIKMKGATVGLHKGYKDLYIPNAIQRTIEVSVTKLARKSDEIGSVPTTITIPITIKTHVIFTDVDKIINVLEPNSDDKSFFNRLDEYKAGAISLADLIFTGDLIKKYKKNKIKDVDGLLEIIQSRKLSANSKITNINNAYVGFEKYYNMYIISADDKVVIEKHLKGRLSKDSYKQKFLDQSYGLSVTVMDQDYERIQIMLRDIRGRTDLNYKTLKRSKNDGSNMDEIVKALLANKPPVF